MKRLWIGITVLAVLLGSGLLAGFFLERHHGPICQALEEASRLALDGDLDKAEELTKNAQGQWENCLKWTSALVEHGILEEAEYLFAEAEVFCQSGDAQKLAATCARLSKLIEAIAQSHHTSWQNVL